MAENSIRMSQLVGTFGPGAMLDLPDRSVLVLGLDHWEMQGQGGFPENRGAAIAAAAASAVEG